MKYGDTIKFVTIDMYKSARIAAKLGITQFPALALIRNRTVCYRTTDCCEETAAAIEREIIQH